MKRLAGEILLFLRVAFVVIPRELAAAVVDVFISSYDDWQKVRDMLHYRRSSKKGTDR